MLMSHFICQTVRNTSFRLYSRPSSVTNGEQRDRNHPFSLLQCRQGNMGGGGGFARRSGIQIGRL